MSYLAMLRSGLRQFWALHVMYFQMKMFAIRARLGLYTEGDLHRAEERGATWALDAATDRDLQVWLADDIVASSADPYNPSHDLTAATLCRRMREKTSQVDLDRIAAQAAEEEAERAKIHEEAEARWAALMDKTLEEPKKLEPPTSDASVN